MPKFYKKRDDQEVLDQIRNVIQLRPSYGYKRVTSMINRERQTMGFENYNKKRILRVMQMNGIVLSKATKSRNHTGTGKVMTLHSNTRWCSDCFEIKCFNGEKVYVIFVLDTCDREAMSFIAKKEPILSEDVQSLIIMATEQRFGTTWAPREIELLSDRGSIYRAKETVQMARQFNLRSCFTMAYSPESNGMAESFVKTIKRDYVYTNDCFDADTVLEMLPKWFADYNEIAPHSALGMLSPITYRQKIS